MYADKKKEIEEYELAYFNQESDEVYAQIEELEKYAKSDLAREEQVAHYREILLNRKFAMDYRSTACDKLYNLVETYPKLVVPVLIEFMESGETYFDDPNYHLSKAWDMIDRDKQYNIYSDENWFVDIKETAINALKPWLPETKEAIHVLIDIVKNFEYMDYIDSTLQVLYELGEQHPDIRYIILANLYDEIELNDSARLLIDYLEEFHNERSFSYYVPDGVHQEGWFD
ncbi:MAG: hypothetical protein ACTSSK_01090 [Candidatus Heimdallarchaeota archaeon]